MADFDGGLPKSEYVYQGSDWYIEYRPGGESQLTWFVCGDCWDRDHAETCSWDSEPFDLRF